MADQEEFESKREYELRARIMGMGADSMRKSYYPVLQHRIDQLEHYKKLLNRVHEGILLLELPTLTITDSNIAACDLLEIECEQLRAKSLFDLLPSDIGGELRLWLGELTPGNPSNLQLTFCLKTGQNSSAQAKWLEVSLSSVEEDGQTEIVSIVRDITQFYQQNAALRKSEQTLQVFFDNSFQFTGILDTQGYLLAINKTAVKAIHAESEDVLGRLFWDTPWWEGLPEERARLQQTFSRCLAGEVVRYHCQNACGKDKRIWMDYSMKPIRNENNQIIMIIPEGRDISETKMLEEQLLQSQKMESIGQLAGGVAHDFNNLLGGIIGAADLMAIQGPLNDEQEKLRNLILSAADDAADLTSKLLAFARKRETNSTVINIHDILVEVKLLLERSIDKRISISLGLDAAQHQVAGDPVQIKNAFLNLGINARDAMANGGKLSITTTNVKLTTRQCANITGELDPGEYIVVTFCDTGCGISPDHLLRIFEPFFTTKETGKGTGLGLAAVYGMVKTHHGSIHVSSEAGTGTTFILHFPLDNTVMQLAMGQMPIHTLPVKSGCLLLADDEQINRTTISMMLEKLGYTFIIAKNGKEAVEQYSMNRDKIVGVILDLVMPEMNGGDAYREIRKINPLAKALIMSGFTADISIRKLEEEGIVGFLHKPFHLNELSEKTSAFDSTV